MSRFGLPQQVKIEIVGVPEDSEAARQLLRDHRGGIAQFYAKASQAQRLGITDSSYTQQQLGPDLDVRYLNNQGQERLQLRPAARPPKPEPKPEPKVKEPWDWAVIDFQAPMFKYFQTHTGAPVYTGTVGTTQISRIADLTAIPAALPPDVPWPDSAADWFTGKGGQIYTRRVSADRSWTLSADWSVWFTGVYTEYPDVPYNPVTLGSTFGTSDEWFPGTGVTYTWDQTEVTDGLDCVSLRVDLRPWRGAKMIQYEIYGRYYQRTPDLFWSVHFPDGAHAYIFDSWPGGTIGGVFRPAGTKLSILVGSGSIPSFNYLYPQYSASAGYVVTEFAPGSSGWPTPDRDFLFDVYGSEFAYNDPMQELEVRYATFRGTPKWAMVAQGKPQVAIDGYVYDYEMFRARWCVQNHETRRFSTGRAGRGWLSAEVLVDEYVGSRKFATRQAPYLGMLTISLEDGWVAFNPAPERTWTRP